MDQFDGISICCPSSKDDTKNGDAVIAGFLVGGFGNKVMKETY